MEIRGVTEDESIAELESQYARARLLAVDDTFRTDAMMDGMSVSYSNGIIVGLDVPELTIVNGEPKVKGVQNILWAKSVKDLVRVARTDMSEDIAVHGAKLIGTAEREMPDNRPKTVRTMSGDTEVMVGGRPAGMLTCYMNVPWNVFGTDSVDVYQWESFGGMALVSGMRHGVAEFLLAVDTYNLGIQMYDAMSDGSIVVVKYKKGKIRNKGGGIFSLAEIGGRWKVL